MEPRSVKLLRALFASPVDTRDERAVARRVVEEINRVWGEYAGVLYRALMWESDSYTATAEGGQAVINRELGDEYHVFVGIMRERFGSPTKRDSSGTKEEYERAYARLRPNIGVPEIGFYFSNAPVSRERFAGEAAEQLRRVVEFQREVRERGTLTQEYGTLEEFETRLRLQLSKIMQKWASRLPTSPYSERSVLITDTAPGGPESTSPPSRLISALTLTEDLQLASGQLSRATEIRTAMTRAIAQNTDRTTEQTELVKEAGDSGDTSRMTRALRQSQMAQAQGLAAVGDVIGASVIPLAQNTRGPLLTGSRLALYAAASGQSVEAAHALGGTIVQFREELDSNLQALSQWRESLDLMPVTTVALFRSREYCVYAIDALLSETRNLSQLAGEVSAALESL